MPTLPTLAADSTIDEILQAMEHNGAAIIEGVLSEKECQSLKIELQPLIENTRMGGDDFSGRATQRTGALVARSPLTRNVIMNALVLQCADRFLAPFTEKIVLHLTQTINIHPGQGEQTLHRDRLAWGQHLPLSIEPQFNTIWALTDFSESNGATRVVPGSHRWDWQQRAAPEDICQAEMKAGSVLLYSGSVIHSGGCNRSDQPRLGLNITYCLGWLRQEENQYLSCPPEFARTLPEDLQELLGYTMGNYALGYYSDPAPDLGVPGAAGILPPESILGRKPRSAMGLTGTGVDS